MSFQNLTGLEETTLQTVLSTGTISGAIGKAETFLIKQLIDTLPSQDKKSINQALSLLHQLMPQNAMEGTLCAQMVATHVAGMRLLANAMQSDSGLEIEFFMDRAVKMQGLFSRQLEVLLKLRAGGQQKMIVEHVHVYPGGQAVIGSVTHDCHGKQTEVGITP